MVELLVFYGKQKKFKIKNTKKFTELGKTTNDIIKIYQM